MNDSIWEDGTYASFFASATFQINDYGDGKKENETDRQHVNTNPNNACKISHRCFINRSFWLLSEVAEQSEAEAYQKARYNT